MSSQAVLRQFDPSSVVREPVQAKSSYVPSPRDERHAEHVIRLDMNESPYGPSPKAQAAIAAFVTTHRYPDFDQWALRDAIAAYTGVTAEQIFDFSIIDGDRSVAMISARQPAGSASFRSIASEYGS